jgi:DNA-binding PadR family transcriptional regulator
MSLSFALLGFLNLGPMTGYDLKKNLDRSTEFFWHAGLNQIYPTLKTLLEQGLVTARVEPQEGRPDKRIYALTEDGQAALFDWLAEPVKALPPTRNVALLKLFFAGFLDREAILGQLRNLLALHQSQLRRYREETRSVIAEVVAATGLRREGMMWELVRQLGEAHERTYVEWLERAIRNVESL